MTEISLGALQVGEIAALSTREVDPDQRNSWAAKDDLPFAIAPEHGHRATIKRMGVPRWVPERAVQAGTTEVVL